MLMEHQRRPMKLSDTIHLKGSIEIIIEQEDGQKETICFPNTVLRKGREALASSLANQFGDTYDFFISRMLFGDGGTSGGTPKFVNTERNGLFGVVQVSKPVVTTIDTNVPSQVVVTSVMTFDEGNGVTINELSMQMNTGDLYSMATFGGIAKTRWLNT